MKRRTIRVNALARVEGEGALTIRFKDDRPKSVELDIYEPPRFFEAFLRSRSQLEVPDITARICGICPVAYQMSACHAIENALGIAVTPEIRALRRFLYCGEWIESHTLHAFFLHAPDFFGVSDAIELSKLEPELVKNALRIKKAGNAIVSVLGGREIHPINVKLGGFYRVPTRAEMSVLGPELAFAKGATREALERFARLDFPDFSREYEFIALRHPDEYPFNQGRIVSNKGLDLDVSEYENVFEEEHVARSNALHSRIKARGSYLTGPLARFNLNFETLRPEARDAARAVGLVPACNNPFKSLLVRMIETLQALDEALAFVNDYDPPAEASVPIPTRAAVGFGATEAPRGLLYHRYRVSDNGTILEAKIVPPTSQNQISIEEDLYAIAARLASLPHADATRLAEQTIRNYDPCISCSVHFLKLAIEHEAP